MGMTVLGMTGGAVSAALALWVLLRCALPLFRRQSGKSRPVFTLTLLTALQLLLLLQQLLYTPAEHRVPVALSFAALLALGWGTVLFLQKKGARGAEPVLLALLLTTAGFSVAASATPAGMGKQSLVFALGVGAFFAVRWLLSDGKRTKTLRWPMVFASAALLAVNLLLSERVWGAKNWLSIAGQSLQPSELVKIAYIWAGAALPEEQDPRRGMLLFTGFSAAVAAALALMGDFGTAAVFFLCYLMILCLRCGVLLTGLAALGGGAAAGAVLMLKPYVARRFLTWGHAWDSPLDEGFQQVRAMSAAASGGLFGRGAGNGWLRDVVAADTDLVFGMVCEELGLLFAAACVLAVAALALWAVRRGGKRAFPLVAGCAAATVFLVQTSLNVFGSMDLLPFTGVTFPFVSRGGSSLIACWAMLAYMTEGGGQPPAKKKAAGVPAKKPAPAKPAAEPAPAKTGTGKKTAAKAPDKKPAAAKPAAKKPTTKTPASSKPTTKPAAKPAAKTTAARTPARKPASGAGKTGAGGGKGAGK